MRLEGKHSDREEKETDLDVPLRDPRSSLAFSFYFSASCVRAMRRDRLFLAVTLTAVLSADLYLVLLPKLRGLGRGSGPFCPCGPVNLTLPRHGGLATPRLYNWSSVAPGGGAPPEPADRGSKLGRLFDHPLYNIQSPAPGPQETLLQEEDLVQHYRKKVSHWERSVSLHAARFVRDFG